MQCRPLLSCNFSDFSVIFSGARGILIFFFFLRSHPDALSSMAEALLKRETLNYEDVESLLGPPPHGKKHLVTPTEYERQLREQADMAEQGKKE